MRGRRGALLGGAVLATVLVLTAAYAMLQPEPGAPAVAKPPSSPPVAIGRAAPTGERASATPASAPTATVHPAAALPSPTPAGAVCPFTGLTVDEAMLGRAGFIVQVENHPEARPQSNLGAADIIVETTVEGDTTRFSGIFMCQGPAGPVGPVRSARYYNVDLWQQLHLVTVGTGTSAGGYSRFANAGVPYLFMDLGWAHYFPYLAGHPAPHNVYLDLDGLVGGAGSDPGVAAMLGYAGPPRSPFIFDAEADHSAVGRPVSSVTIWTNSFWSFGWHHDPPSNTYHRSDQGFITVDAVDGAPLARRSVLVQIVSQEVVTGDPDPGGYDRRLQHLVGSGIGVLYVDGRAIDVAWSRPTPADITTWTIAETGAPLLLPPGEVYWGLIPTTSALIEE